MIAELPELETEILRVALFFSKCYLIHLGERTEAMALLILSGSAHQVQPAGYNFWASKWEENLECLASYVHVASAFVL